MATKLNHFRSGYESLIAQDLEQRGIHYEFEKQKLPYLSTVRGGVCPSCGHKPVAKTRQYQPDFFIPRSDGSVLIVEAKGRFPSTDRSKMRDVKKANPTLDIRILFQKRSGKAAAEAQAWCDKFGFICAFGHHVPQEWIDDESTAQHNT